LVCGWAIGDSAGSAVKRNLDAFSENLVNNVLDGLPALRVRAPDRHSVCEMHLDAVLDLVRVETGGAQLFT